MNQSKPQIHFIGIKGVGMSALALVANGLGHNVSGSDVNEQFITDQSLQDAGIFVASGFNADHIPTDTGLVVVGGSFDQNNPEVIAAKQRNLQILTYSEFLGQLSDDQKTIAIAGTHGKTTTTALLAYIFEQSGEKPSYVIGTGSVAGLKAPGAAGEGEYFITEADDYKRSVADPTPKFLDLKPYAAIVTSIEHDHPDLFPTLQSCTDAFVKFATKLRPDGFLVVNADDAGVTSLRAIITNKKVISYGHDNGADYRITLSQTDAESPVRFSLVTATTTYGPFELGLRGRHNLSNAAAAVTMALELGLSPAKIQAILPTFESVERRYDYVGKRGEIDIYDDYAHHPTAVAVTLETLRIQYRRRPLWCVFQPHTYSRTKALLEEFGAAFGAASMVIITDIYASARETEVTVTANELVRAIAANRDSVQYVSHDTLEKYLKENLPSNAVLVTMGAGDIYKIGRALLDS